MNHAFNEDQYRSTANTTPSNWMSSTPNIDYLSFAELIFTRRPQFWS